MPIEITHNQILDDGFPVADIAWKPNASVTETYEVQDVYDVQGAYDEGFKEGQGHGEELGVESNHDFADDELAVLLQKVVSITDNDLDILPEHIHEDTASAVLNAVINLINAARSNLEG